MPTPRGTPAAAAIGGKLYVVGGHSAGFATNFNKLEVYDPATDTWDTTKAPIPTARDAMGAAAIDGKFYVVGGFLRSGNVVTGVLEVYDPATNTWDTTKAPMPTPRWGLGVGVINGKLHAVGGVGATSVLGTNEVYDPATNSWDTTKAPMPTPRALVGVDVINSLLYASGGSFGAAGSGFKLEVYTPDAVVSNPPVANAGPNQAVGPGDTVVLDGSGSSDDNTATAALIYAWSFSSVPVGSSAVLSGADTQSPSFVADVAGTYVVQLVVTDQDALSSTPDEVLISSSDNLAPTANAGNDVLVFTGDFVTLDGSGSSDPELDPITFSWTLISSPVGSTAVLTDANTVSPSLTPDLGGTYVVELIVSDFIGPSAPDTVQITATNAETFAETQIQFANDIVTSLPPSSVTTKGNQTALTNFLSQATVAIQAGDLVTARDKLEKAIARTDGCVLRGAPDGNGPGRDWITDCAAQEETYNLLNDALAALTP